MKCFWLDHGNSYLKLGPFKTEMKLKIPEIMVMHNFVSVSEAETMISSAKGKLSASPLYVGENSEKGKVFFYSDS